MTNIAQRLDNMIVAPDTWIERGSRLKIVKISIVLFWFVMLGLLVERSYIRPTPVSALDAAAEEGVKSGDEWFGIYQHGRKIGYAHTRVIREGNAYHIYEESEMDILVLGSVQRVKTVINSYATKNLILKYFDFSMKSDYTDMLIKGAVLGNELVLDIETAGQTRKEHIRLKEQPYLSPNIKPAVILQGLEQGRKYHFPMFNPATLSTEDAYISIEAVERIKVGDREETVYKLKEEFQGMEAVSWLSQDGWTLKEESPLGYVLLKETMQEAMKRDKQGPAVDIISFTSIPSNKIDNSSGAVFLKARLNGVRLDGYELSAGRQRLIKDIIEVIAEQPAASYRLPYSGSDMAAHLAPSGFVQSDDRGIKEQARRIIGKEVDAVQAAKKLSEWVYNSIHKQPVVSIPSAVEILKQRVGDCNEHTTLYTALARSIGLPTRMAVGIVYMENGFYYHAWPEVWLGAWVAVDPTLNQFPADATHIRFVTGGLDRQTEILRIVGKLRVEVLEYDQAR